MATTRLDWRRIPTDRAMREKIVRSEIPWRLIDALERADLSPSGRERDVMRLSAAGLAYPRIAERLGISEDTVGHYAEMVTARSDTRTLREAIAYYAERGWLDEAA